MSLTITLYIVHNSATMLQKRPCTILEEEEEGPNQDPQNVDADGDPNHLTLIVFLKKFLKKVNFDKESADDNKSIKKITQHAKC